MSPKNKEIGDPLEQVAATGKIGSARPVPRSPEVQKSSTPETQASGVLGVQKSGNSKFQTSGLPETSRSGTLEPQTSNTPEVQKSGNSKVSNNRVQRTVYLPPPLAKWLKVQAAEEEREMSEIVAEALEEYRRTH